MSREAISQCIIFQVLYFFAFFGLSGLIESLWTHVDTQDTRPPAPFPDCVTAGTDCFVSFVKIVGLLAGPLLYGVRRRSLLVVSR